jgi:toxin ParE1/3/4
MKMKVVWTHFAQNQLDEIYHYCLEEAEHKTAFSLMQSILKHPKSSIKNLQTLGIVVVGSDL